MTAETWWAWGKSVHDAAQRTVDAYQRAEASVTGQGGPPAGSRLVSGPTDAENAVEASTANGEAPVHG